MSKKIISYCLMIMTFCLISQSVDADNNEDLDLHVDKGLSISPLNPNDVLFSPDEDRIIAICDIRSSIPSTPLFSMVGGSMFLPPNIDSINSKIKHINGKLYYGFTEHELAALTKEHMKHDDSSSKRGSIIPPVNRGTAILRSLEDFIFSQDTNSSPCDNSPLHSALFPGITINELD